MKSNILAFTLFLSFNVFGQYNKIGPDVKDLFVSKVESEMTTLNNVPYVAFTAHNRSTGRDHQVCVKKYNSSTNSWDWVGQPYFSPGNAEALRLESDGKDLYVAFADKNRSKTPTVMKYSNNTWSVLGRAGFSADVVNTSEKIDLEFSKGVPYVTYLHLNQGYIPKVYRYQGAAWQALNLPTKVKSWVKIETAPNGNIYLLNKPAYSELDLYEYNGSAWKSIGAPLKCSESIDDFEFEVNGNDVYCAISFGVSVNQVFELYKLVGGNWIKQGKSIIEFKSARNDIKLGFNNSIPIIYFDIDGDVFARSFSAGSWGFSSGKGFVCSDRYEAEFDVCTGKNGKAYVVQSNSRKNNVVQVYGFECKAPAITWLQASGSDTACVGDSIYVYARGELNGANSWKWSLGSCSDTIIKSKLSGNLMPVKPVTTFYLSTESKSGGCYNSTYCDSITLYQHVINEGLLITNNSLESKENSANSYQWVNCDSSMKMVAGETSKLFKPTDKANYAVIISKNGCVDTSECRSTGSVGLAQINQDQEILLFPNPTSSNVNIKFKNLLSGRIVIFSISGKVVYDKPFLNKENLVVGLQYLQKGQYFLKVETTDKVYFERILLN